MNTNRINIQCVEDFELLHTISRIVKHYEEHHQDEITVRLVDINGHSYEQSYCNCKKIHDNYERIVKVNGMSGYVVLDDRTIMCICSSDWVAQFDGCPENELNLRVE